MLQIIMKTFKHTLIKQDMNKLIHCIVKYINQACTITAQSHSYLSQSIKHSTSKWMLYIHFTVQNNPIKSNAYRKADGYRVGGVIELVTQGAVSIWRKVEEIKLAVIQM